MSVNTLVKSIQDIMRRDTGVDGDAQRIGQLCWMFFLKIIDDQDKELELTEEDYTSPIPKRFQWRTWAGDAEGITGEKLIAFIDDDLFPALKNLHATGPSDDRRRVVRSVFEDAYNYMKSGQLMRQVVNKINEIDFNDLAEIQHFGDIYEQILNDLQSAGNAGEYYTPRAVTAFMVDRIDPKPGEILFDPACGTGGFLTCSLRHMRARYVKRPEDVERIQTSLRAVDKKQLPHMLCVTNMLLHKIKNPSFVTHDNTLARPYISWEKRDRVDIVLTNPPFGGKEEDGIESNFPQHFRTKETADLFLALIIRVLKPGGRAAVVLPDGSLFGEGVKTRLKEHLMAECNLHTIVRLPNSVFQPYASIGTNLLFFEKGAPTERIWFYEHLVPKGQKSYSKTKPIRIEHLRDCMDWWGGPERTGRRKTERAWQVTAEEVKARGYNLDIKNPHTAEDAPGDPEELLTYLTATESETATLRDQLKTVLGTAAMNTDQLLAHFTQVADAPDAIPRLRQFILDLAVRGKLVPQDPNDEPASELLKRMKQEKARLVKRGEIRKGKVLPAIEIDERPFGIPAKWRWVKFGNIADFSAGRTPTRNELSFWNTGDYPWISISDMSDGETLMTTKETVSEKAAKQIFRSAPKQVGTLIMSFKLTIGKIARLGIPAYHNEAIISICPYVSELDPYLFKILPFFARQGDTKGAIKGATLNRESISNISIPCPPLAEQHRIVAKVDELMALCDRLEASLATGNDTKQRLLNALLHAALVPDVNRLELVG